MKNVWDKLGLFMPPRLQNIFIQSEEDFELKSLSALDDVTMPQSVELLVRKKEGVPGSENKTNAEELKRVSLDGFLFGCIQDFCVPLARRRESSKRLNKQSSGVCKKIVGAPGSGKTYCGLRLHLLLLKRYLLSIQQASIRLQGNPIPPFPIWISFHELQGRLSASKSQKPVSILSDVLADRLSSYSDSAIAELSGIQMPKNELSTG